MMAIGFLSRCCGLIKEEDIGKINQIVFTIFLPLMIFKNIYSSDLQSAVQPKLLAFAGAGLFSEFLISAFFTKRFVPDGEKRGVIIHALFRTNYTIVGLPVAAALVPGADLSAVTFVLVVFIPLTNILGIISLEALAGKKVGMKKTVSEILKNPLLIASVFGVLFLVFRLRLPPVLSGTVNAMAAVANPVLLFLLGAFFRPSRVKDNMRYLIGVCAGRLVFLPAIFLSIAAALGFRGIEYAAMIGLFGASSATSTFPIAQQMGGDAKLAGDIVIVSGILSILTIFSWSVLSSLLGMF